ncbi:MAG: metal ABC transporter substrate-binding protein [Bdellovibrionales bacterium]
MKKLVVLAVLPLLCVISTAAHARVNVFACEPEWGAVAREIGGDKVDVFVATTARQDVHQIQARPSLIAAMRNAQMVFCSGAELETGWLPILLRQSGNGSVQEGQGGSLFAASYVKKLDVPKKLDRSQGDLHAEGNPHIVTDPRNVRIVAKVFADRLKSLDAANTSAYDARYKEFDRKFGDATKEWESRAAALRGMPVVVKHNVWVYLSNWLGINVVASLEPKPGVPPTPGHLAELLARLQAMPAQAIVIGAYEDPQAAQWLAEKSRLPIITLPYTVGGNDRAEDIFGLYDDTINQLLTATK